MKTFLPAALFALALPTAAAAEFQVTTADKSVPEEVAEPVRELLQTRSVHVAEDGQPLCRFWFVAKVPLESPAEKPGAAFGSLRETSLLGVVAVHRPWGDYRNDPIPPGVYTMRYAWQPEDGNHLGTALYPYFLVLVPAENDPRPDRFRTSRALVNASSRANPTSHPYVISLRPPVAEEGPFPSRHQPEAGHETVRVQLPAQADETETHIIFELVYHGTGTH